MRENLKLCYAITEELFEKSKINDDYSDEQYNELEMLLNKREAILTSLNPPFTEGEKLLGIKIVELNNNIEHQMNSIKSQIAEKIKNLNKKEQYVGNYTAYEGSTYGYFYDKKK